MSMYDLFVLFGCCVCNDKIVKKSVYSSNNYFLLFGFSLVSVLLNAIYSVFSRAYCQFFCACFYCKD